MGLVTMSWLPRIEYCDLLVLNIKDPKCYLLVRSELLLPTSRL